MLPALRRAFSTVNTSEIAHFSRLSAQWWDEHGEFIFLHRMNPVRMQFIRDKLAETYRDEDRPVPAHGRILEGMDVLDVGCGGGLLSESLTRLGARTLGIDASESNIAIAQHHASSDSSLSNLSYRPTSAESLLKEGTQYDVVCSMEVIEHVDNPALFLETCADLVKPSGHLFLSTIARTPLSYFLTILMAERVLRKVSTGTHTHSKYINPTELAEFFHSKLGWTSASFPPSRTEAEVRGIVYNPLASGWMLGPRVASTWDRWSTECNYVFWARKPAELKAKT